MNSSLIEISNLSQDDFDSILSMASSIANGVIPKFDNDFTIASLFYENSTRTRISFELAAKRLGVTFINVDVEP